MPISSSAEQFIASQKAAFDTLLSFANLSLNSIDQINSLNLATSRALLTGQLEGVAKFLSAKNPQDALSSNANQIQPQIEQIADYVRQLHEITSQAQEEFVKLLEEQHAELNIKLSSLLDGYAKTSGDSGSALAAVKSAISAANSAFAKANQAARQVADITGASVSATVQAIGAANQAQTSSRSKKVA